MYWMDQNELNAGKLSGQYFQKNFQETILTDDFHITQKQSLEVDGIKCSIIMFYYSTIMFYKSN